MRPGREWGQAAGRLGPPLPPAVIILSILEVIIILLLIFLRKRILIAIALIKEASRWAPGCRGLGWGGPRASRALMPVSTLPQGCGIRDVLPAIPTGHLSPAVPLHRLLGQHCCVSTLRPGCLTPGVAKGQTCLEVTCDLGGRARTQWGNGSFLTS